MLNVEECLKLDQGMGHWALPVADDGVELDDGLLFVLGELAVLEVRPEVVRPSQPATLPTPLEPWYMRIKVQHTVIKKPLLVRIEHMIDNMIE